MTRKRLRRPEHFERLLTLLVIDLLISGLHSSPFIRLVNASLALLTVIVAVTVTGLRHRIPQWQIVAVVALSALSLGIGAISGDFEQGVSAIAGAFALGVLLVAALKEVLDVPEVDLQTLYGALCVYLLLGLLFARVFSAIDAISSVQVFNPTGHTDTTYFSFTTLTTVGYGDVTAIGPLARRVAVVEGIVGQVFLATMVARLVSLYRSPRERTNTPPDEMRG